MVFKKQYNAEGQYIEKDIVTTDEDNNEVIIPGVNRYDVLSCERTESLESYETGEYEEVEGPDGETIQIPVVAQRIVINKGWDDFGTLENALEQYGLVEYHEQQEVEEESSDETLFTSSELLED